MNGLWQENINQKENYIENYQELKDSNASSPINLYIHFPFVKPNVFFVIVLQLFQKIERS